MGKPRGDALRAEIEQGEVERTKKLLIAASPDEKKALASFASARLKEVTHRELKEVEPGTHQWVSSFNDRQRSTARYAVAASATRFHDDLVPFDDQERDELIAFVTRLRPAWLEGAAEAAVARGAHRYGWAFARALVREGLSQRPTSPTYVRGMMSHVRPWGDKRPLSQVLLADPGLLEDEVWKCFEVGGSGADYLSPLWEQAFIELSKQGKLSRDRLLDASLDALERDFTQFHAGWFSRFHEALAPSIEERANRTDRYARLLVSPIGPTVSFALGALGVLAKAGRLKIDTDQLRPALLARAKKTALAALKLGGDDAALAVVALGHEAKEVQGAAIAVLERTGASKTAIGNAARERLDSVAASLRPRLAALLGTEVGKAVHGTRNAPPKEKKKVKPPARLSSLDPSRAIAPIVEVDELLERLAATLETPDEPDEIERVLDGLSRLCAIDVEDLAERRAPLC